MSGRFVRQSSYRHVFGTEAKKAGLFQDIRIDASGNGPHISANDKYFAISMPGGGGPVMIGNLEAPGRFRDVKKLSVHRGKVLATEFNPFISTMIATASEDCYAKVSTFPAGGLTENINECVATLEGHQKKVLECHWNPVASNVLATSSADNTIKTWDVENQCETTSLDFNDNPYSFDWNSNGSMIATTNKDKKLYIFDPRQADSVQSADNFPGSKMSSVRWMDNHGLLVTIGFTKSSMRQYAVWDPKNLSKPLVKEDLDQSAGVLIPHYDPDNSILYIGGKGDGGIKYFEVQKEAPYMHFLSEFRTNQSQKGLCFIPKRGVDVSKCEIAKALRVMRDSVNPVSFCVPRKSEIFQRDLFPDTYAGVPSQTAAEWMSGATAEPKTMTLDPKKREDVVEAVFEVKKSPAELRAELEAANKRIAELEAELKKLKA